MLQTKSVSIGLLELLTRIMKEDVFDQFYLVGGTALALQIGHRVSVDIDMFGKCEIQEDLFLEKLSTIDTVTTLKKSQNILICKVGNVKVDFVNYQYPIIENIRETNTIRMASIIDIAAMKLNAIAGRGSKKDFIDIYYLLRTYSIEQLIALYLKKYNDGSEFLVRKSLTYFDDADTETTPYMFENIAWEDIKLSILEKV
jgi:predicted nucleotidyltransferase component of viral defense system